MNCILLRYGEIGLKSKRKRPLFEKLYVDAIKVALKNVDFSLENLGGRFVLNTNSVNKVIPVLKRVPGIQSLSPASKIEFSSKSDLLKKLEKFENLAENKSFCVKVRRIGFHKFSSISFAAESAGVFFDKSSGVDLKNPEIKINLEIRDNQCFLFTKSIRGLGGLPPKSAGKVLCLFSGGLDSPVAAFQMMKRGCQVDFLFINLSGEKEVHDVAQIYNFVTSQFCFNYVPKLFIINGNNFVKKIKNEVPDKLKQIALKIALYQLAERICSEHKYTAFVTGESLSQKSSQTLESLAVIQSQISTPVLRPLIGLDKLDITCTAERIGTFASSQKIKEFCNLSDGPVSTVPRMDVLQFIPSFSKLVSDAFIIMHKGVVDVVETSHDVKLENVVTVSLDNSVDADMIIPYPIILDQLDAFNKDKSYLLVCDFGVRSESVAFLLRKRGVKAAGITTKNFLKYIRKNKPQNNSQYNPVKAVQ